MGTKLIEGNPELTKLRIQALQEQLAVEHETLDRQTSPIEPEDANAVIRFAKYGQAYSFAAIKTGKSFDGRALWYITQDGSRTSRQGHAPKTWPDLVTWIGQRNWGLIEVLS